MQDETTVRQKAEQGVRMDVVFVGNDYEAPQKLADLRNERDLEWAEVSVDKFYKSIKGWTQISAVVVDTASVEKDQAVNLKQTIKKLEEKGVSTLLLKNRIGLEVSEFSRMTVMKFPSPDRISGKLSEILGKSGDAQIYDEPPDLTYDEESDDTVEQLKLAGKVQRSFLPASLPNSEKVSWASLFQPADWVSGDIYDVTRLDETHIGFYILDAVGHSMPAALLTMYVKNSMVGKVTGYDSYRLLEPAEVLANLNRDLAEQHLGGSLFVTCCYCLLNTADMTLSYARAGHPYPLLIRKGQDPEPLETNGSLAGIFPEAEFEQKQTQLEKGDKIFLYSDGAEPNIGKCGDDGHFSFSGKFLSLRGRDVLEMVSEFGQMVSACKIDPAQVDDVTVLAMQYI